MFACTKVPMYIYGFFKSHKYSALQAEGETVNF